MPKDDWAKARAKDAAKRGKPFIKHDRKKRLRAAKPRRAANLVTITPGTSVQVRKIGQPGKPVWKRHTVRAFVKAPISRRYGDTLYLHFKGWEIQFNSH